MPFNPQQRPSSFTSTQHLCLSSESASDVVQQTFRSTYSEGKKKKKNSTCLAVDFFCCMIGIDLMLCNCILAAQFCSYPKNRNWCSPTLQTRKKKTNWWSNTVGPMSLGGQKTSILVFTTDQHSSRLVLVNNATAFTPMYGSKQ